MILKRIKRKVLTIFCLFFFITPLQASEWLKVVEANSGSYWIKTETVLRAASKLSVQQLTDFKVRQSTGEKSSISFLEINCSNSTLRETRYLTYSENKASGRLLSDDDLIKFDLAKWRKAQKNTADGILVEMMCKHF